MHDHAGHTPQIEMPEKPDAGKKNTPAKPSSTPAAPDPHAGHDMGKSEKPITAPKGPDPK